MENQRKSAKNDRLTERMANLGAEPTGSTPTLARR